MMVIARPATLGLQIICPHCHFGSRYDASFVEDAIKYGQNLKCVACGKELKVIVKQARPRGPTLRAPAEAGGVCWKCKRNSVFAGFCRNPSCSEFTPRPGG